MSFDNESTAFSRMRDDAGGSVGGSGADPPGLWNAVALLTFLTTLIVYLLVVNPHETEAWGRDGHEIVANVAYRRLSRSARAEINAILLSPSSNDDRRRGDVEHQQDDDGDTPLARVADWPDRVRYTKEWSWSAPLHFVDVRDDAYEGGCRYRESTAADDERRCELVYERDCANDFCVAGAIANYSVALRDVVLRGVPSSSSSRADGTQRLRSSAANDRAAETTRRDAWEDLSFVVHFVGDVHQPLHVSRKSDKGGNIYKVDFDDGDPKARKKHKWNLHSVWDTGMILRSVREEFNSSRAAFEREIEKLIVNDDEASWSTCDDGTRKSCTAAWATESFEEALQYAYRSEKGEDIGDSWTLTDEYYSTRIPVVKRKLALAGARLASTLEHVLGSESRFVAKPQ